MGSNYSGQSGDGTGGRDTLMQKQTAADAIAVASGSYCNYFIKSDKTLWGMGANNFGQLGNGTTAGSNVPIPISSGVIAVDGGNAFALFLKEDHSLWAMGRNNVGQLGDGTTSDRSLPVKVAVDVIAISTGGSHAGFVKSDGSLWTMGDNSRGQLGDGSTTSRSAPVQVAQNVSALFFGGNCSLFLTSDQKLLGMGANDRGQLGDGSRTDKLSATPIASNVITASTSGESSFYVRSDKTLWGTGSDVFANPDDGIYETRMTPKQLDTGVTGIASAVTHTLFTRSDGSLWAVGSNSCGPFGLGVYGPIFPQPIQVSSMAPVPLQTVAAPKSTPAGGAFSGGKMVSLSSTTPGATIFYSIDSSDPLYYGRIYQEPFLVPSTSTVRALALKGDYLPSSETSSTFIINSDVPIVGAPVFRPAGGEYWSDNFPVTITSVTPGAIIHYEIGNQYPSTFSPKYTGPISLPAGFQGTITARAFKAGMWLSPMRSADFVINAADDPTIVVTPTIGYESQTFSRSQTIKLDCRTKGATIYYTLDGSDPSASSIKYKRHFTIRATTTIKAIGVKAGLTDSGIASVYLRKKK